MKLNDILMTCHVNPMKSRKYAKEICSNLHGTVQKSMVSKIFSLLFSIFISIYMLVISRGVIFMLFSIVFVMALVVMNMYTFSWKLTFNGETGFFSFHTMFKGTITFHVSEIGRITVRKSHYQGRTTEYLIIPVNHMEISVFLRRYFYSPSKDSYQGGHTDVEKLEQYLTLYQQFLAKDADFMANDDDLSPAVRAAIVAQKRQQGKSSIPQQVEPKTEMPSVPEISSAPEATVNLKKESAPTEKISLRKESDPNFPDPAKPQNSAFPDPAMSRKEVDADALFNDVLGQFGKAPSPPPSGKSKKETDVDALFDNVLKQFGKK